MQQLNKVSTLETVALVRDSVHTISKFSVENLTVNEAAQC